MAAEIEPRSGLTVGFEFGESGWDTDIEATLKSIARLKMGGGVIDRDATDPSLLSPSAGDGYIVGPSAIGDWASQDDRIAIYDGTVWVFYIAPDGFGIYILDEDVYAVYKSGSGWSDGVAHSWTP